jgi:hypothetical protein
MLRCNNNPIYLSALTIVGCTLGGGLGVERRYACSELFQSSEMLKRRSA